MKKKIFIIIVVIIALLLAAGGYFLSKILQDPNLLYVMMASDIEEDKPQDVTFTHSEDDDSLAAATPLYSFKATENAEYRFELVNIKSNEDLAITLTVTDDVFEDMLSASNYDDELQSYVNADEISGDLYMQKGQECYIFTDVIAADESVKDFEGSFSVNVRKAPEIDDPPLLEIGRTLHEEIRSDIQNCIMFIPDETGYYRFDTRIVSKNAAAGFASISSVTTGEKKDIAVTDGACLLEKDVEYCIWVTALETTRKYSEIEMTAEKMSSIQAEGPGVFDLTEDTMIEFTADEAGTIAVFSESDGDPKASVFDANSYPLRNDDNSGSAITGNEHDFAVVFNAEAGKSYRICVNGDFTGCRLVIGRYIGDGTTLTREDIEIPEVSAAEETGAEAAEAGESEETESPEEEQVP